MKNLPLVKNPSFNTTLVQLKGRRKQHTAPLPLSFNTTLVQLKEEHHSSSHSTTRTFQYHTGPIKSLIFMLPPCPRTTPSFNTTLVQLKDLSQPLLIPCALLFQYHTGPIKRNKKTEQTFTAPHVSIPHWSN